MKTKHTQWPDEVRIKMIEKSKFYEPNERIYEYGYYDGYQKGIEKTAQILNFITEIQQALTDKSKGGTKDGTYSKDEVIDLIDNFCFTEMRSCIEVKRHKGFIEKYLNKKASKLSVLEFSMLNQANEILNKVK